MTTDDQNRAAAAQRWLAEAAAAENARFLGQLITYRDRPGAAAGGDTDQAQVQPVTQALPQTAADAVAENADFQQHVRNYDPNLFRRGRRRKVEWGKPVGPKPETVADAAAADQDFFRSMTHWNP